MRIKQLFLLSFLTRLRRTTAFKLAPIAVVMLPEAQVFAAKGSLAAFERKAGQVLHQSSKISLQKNIDPLNRLAQKVLIYFNKAGNFC